MNPTNSKRPKHTVADATRESSSSESASSSHSMSWLPSRLASEAFRLLDTKIFTSPWEKALLNKPELPFQPGVGSMLQAQAAEEEGERIESAICVPEALYPAAVKKLIVKLQYVAGGRSSASM